MHQSTTPSLSQTIWPRWASRQFLSLPIVQSLQPVTFGYSLSSEAVVMRQFRRWKRLWRMSLTRSHKRTSMEHSRRKMSGNLFNDPRSVIDPLLLNLILSWCAILMWSCAKSRLCLVWECTSHVVMQGFSKCFMKIPGGGWIKFCQGK